MRGHIMDNFEADIMRPKKGISVLSLPITFDYNGGKKEVMRTKVLWIVLLSVFCIVGILWSLIWSNMSFILKIAIAIGILYVTTLIIRKVLLKEKNYKKRFSELLESDYKKDYKEIWGIHTIEDEYPYHVRYRDGKSGIFIALNKDIILGKYEDSEYEHYEAISDAYNIAGSSRINMVHIDYMDVVGSDDRLENSFIALNDVKNPDVKEILTDIFTNLQIQMEERVTTFDVYAFLYKGSDVAAWNVIERILRCFLEANYVTYHIMNANDIRELVKCLYNIEDFSVNEAMLGTFSKGVAQGNQGIIPIALYKGDGTVEKLGKTQKELQEERELDRKKKEALKKSKSKKKKKKDEDEYNIF